MSSTDTQSPNSMLDTLVERVCRLYSLPAVALEIIRLSRDPRIDARKLADCLKNDPALTGQVLKFVNSPMYGLSRRVASIDDAVAVLGVQPLRGIVLSFSLPPQLLAGVEKRVLTRYWKHSLTKALAARELARMTHAEDLDEAFVGGLLQHLGMLALIQELGEPYVEFLSQVWNDRGNLTQLELASLGFDHRVLSSRLAERWQLPVTLGQSLAHPWHHDHIELVDVSVRPAVKRLHLAEHVARLLHDRDEGDWEALVDSAKRHFSMEPMELEDLLRRMDVQLGEIAPLFSLEINETDSFHSMLLESREMMIRLCENWIDPRRTKTNPLAGLAEKLSAEGKQPSAESKQPSAEGKQPSAEGKQPSAEGKQPSAEGKQLSAAARATTDASSSSKTTPLPSVAKPSSSQPVKPAASAFSGNLPKHPSPAFSPLSKSSASAAPTMGLVTLARRSVTKCRQQRWPLSLILIEVDHHQEGNRRYSLAAMELACAEAMEACRAALDPGDQLIPVSDARWGLLFEDCDRGPASTVGRELLQRLRDWSEERTAQGDFPLTFSIGAACVSMILKNFEAEELIDRAERCLSAAQLSGGDSVKTIAV